MRTEQNDHMTDDPENEDEKERLAEEIPIYAAAARGVSSSKPRPVVIVQDDRFDVTASVTVCPLTTNPIEAPLARIEVEVSATTRLDQTSRIMVDKVTTMPRANLRERLGRLPQEDLIRLNRALVVFLGLGD